MSTTALGIYPPLTRINALPGVDVKTPLTLINSSSEEVLLGIKVLGFKSSNDGNGSIDYFTSSDIPEHLSQFISKVNVYSDENQIKSIKLYPNESKNLIVQFKAPEKDSDYYFSLVFIPEVANVSPNSETTVKILNGQATNLILSVGAVQGGTARISELTTTPIKLGKPAHIELEVTNTSKNYISATGDLFIYNLFGEKVGSIKLKPAIILADSDRKMINATETSKNQTVTWNEKFTFGFYTAKAAIRINDTHTVYRETSFFTIPTGVLIAVIILFFIVISIVFRVIKKVNFKSA